MYTGNIKLDSERRKTKTQKSALYQLKYAVLNRIYQKATQVEHHEINGDLFYCIVFDDYSFHIPKDELNADIQCSAHKSLTSFNPSPTPRVPLEFSESLKNIRMQLKLDVNDYLERTMMYSEIDDSMTDIRWNYDSSELAA
jgi:hypothetical protein